jgi:hypothetical protein
MISILQSGKLVVSIPVIFHDSELPEILSVVLDLYFYEFTRNESLTFRNIASYFANIMQ